MNANDLADRLEQFYTGTHIQKAAEELRRLYASSAKTPTDEEIESWITEWAKDLYGTLYVEPTDHQRTMAIKMARAILRKAQEK